MAKMFMTGREMTTPRNSGLYFGQLTAAELQKLSPALTAEEEASPFAAYYHAPMGPLQPEHLAAIQGPPMDPNDCYMPSGMAAHMNKIGPDKVENGYGVMENGVGFAAVRILQEGVTDEMIRHYRENFAPVKDLFYKTWFPGAHIIHFVDGAVEDLGWGMLNMHMYFRADLSALGFDESRILENDPDCIAALTSGAISTPVADPDSGAEIMCMAMYTRQTPTGRELRIRYWLGAGFDEDGKLLVYTKPDKITPLEKAKRNMEHCMREYCNEKYLIKAFWEASRN